MTSDPKAWQSKMSEVGLPFISVIRQEFGMLFDKAIAKHTDGQSALDYFNGDDFIGQAEFYSNGILKSVKPWRNGRPNGAWQEFGESGQLLSHQNFVDGTMHGMVLRWHENESLAYAGEVRAHAGTGTATAVSWSPEGEIVHWRRWEADRNSTAFICAGCRHSTYWESWCDAGFSELGFLYNEDGNFVISWDARDPSYIAIVGEEVWPWALNENQRKTLEDRFLPAPHGGRYLFSNPGRCAKCSGPIARPLPRCGFLWDPKRMVRSGQGDDFPDGPLINYLTPRQSGS